MKIWNVGSFNKLLLPGLKYASNIFFLGKAILQCNTIVTILFWGRNLFIEKLDTRVVNLYSIISAELILAMLSIYFFVY